MNLLLILTMKKLQFLRNERRFKKRASFLLIEALFGFFIAASLMILTLKSLTFQCDKHAKHLFELQFIFMENIAIYEMRNLIKQSVHSTKHWVENGLEIGIQIACEKEETTPSNTYLKQWKGHLSVRKGKFNQEADYWFITSYD